MSDSVGSIQRVMAGAEWLDDVYPEWVGRINLATLDIADGSDCVCGQVFDTGDNCIAFGNFHACCGWEWIMEVASRAGLPNGASLWLNDHGFTREADTETWKMYIGARQAVREQLQKPYKELCLI